MKILDIRMLISSELGYHSDDLNESNIVN